MSHDPYQQPPPVNPGVPPQHGYYQPPVSGGGYPQQYGPPQPVFQPPPPKKSRTGLIVALSIIGGLFGLCVLAGVLGDTGSSNDPDDSKSVKSGKAAATTGAAPASAPKVSHFTLSPKILKKECFGSAGCNVTFQVEVAYEGPKLSEGDTWTVTYEIAGVDDGPLVNSLELSGTEFEGDQQTVGTASTSSKIKLKVTSVEK